VVGAIIGCLIGLRPWVNLALVLVSTYIAIGVWALLLNELNDRASTVNEFAPYALFVAIVLIAAAMRWLGRHREHESDRTRAVG
jgi:cell division protein FtsX